MQVCKCIAIGDWCQYHKTMAAKSNDSATATAKTWIQALVPLICVPILSFYRAKILLPALSPVSVSMQQYAVGYSPAALHIRGQGVRGIRGQWTALWLMFFLPHTLAKYVLYHWSCQLSCGYSISKVETSCIITWFCIVILLIKILKLDPFSQVEVAHLALTTQKQWGWI